MKNLLLLLTIGTLFFSCAKDGKDGVDGAPGPKGDTGNANVIATNTVTVNSGNWVPNGNYYYCPLTVNGITQDVVNSGSVMVYEQNGAYWNALPYTFGILTRTFYFGLQSTTIFYQNTDNSQTTNPGTKTFRIVIIPSSARVTGLNYNDYNQVAEFYNLDLN